MTIHCETLYDFATQSMMNGTYKKISKQVGNAMGNELNDQLVRRLVTNVAYPIYYSGYSISTQAINVGTKGVLEKKGVFEKGDEVIGIKKDK